MANVLDRSTIILRPAGRKAAKLYSQKPTDGAVDFVVTRATEKRVLGESGTLQTNANDVPALEYAADGSYLGLNVERAVTNLLTRSQEFSNNAVWNTSSYNASVSADAVVAPDGTTTADHLIEAVAGGASVEHYARYVAGTTSLSTVTPYTFSVFVKAGARYQGQLRWNGTSTPRIQFDLNTASILSAGSLVQAAGIIPYPNGWYRVWMTFTPTTTSDAMEIMLGNNAGNITYIGDGTSGMYVWGAQLVAESRYPSSYIKTEGLTLPRNADSIRKTGISNTNINNVDREGTLALVARRNLQQFQAEMLNMTQVSASDTNKMFLRTTGADRIQAVVRKGGTSRTNLLLRSQEFETTWTNNSTTESVNVAIAPDGTVTADKIIVDNLAVAGDITQNPTIVSGTQYTYSVYAKAAEWSWLCISVSMITGTRLAWFNLANGTVGTVQSSITASIEMIGNGWYRCSVTGTADNTTGRVRFYPTNQDSPTLTTGNGTSGILLWGAQLETGSVATAYIATDDTLGGKTETFSETVIAQTPASHTNLLLRSQEFDNASWTKNNISFTANTTTNPLTGLINAGTITEATGTTRPSLTIAATIVANSVYTYSFYVKNAIGSRFVNIRVNDSATNNNAATIMVNPSTGSIFGAATAYGTFTNVSGFVESIGSGWYRVAISFVAPVTSIVAKLELSNDGSRLADGQSTTYALDNTSGVFVWGAQLELGGTMSRYVATTAVAVTDSPAVGTNRYLLAYKENDYRFYMNGQLQNTISFSVTGMGTWPVEGSSYTHNGTRYRVTSAPTSGATGIIRMRMISGTTMPTSSGTLTKVGGTGATSITFASYAIDLSATSTTTTAPVVSDMVEMYLGGTNVANNANYNLLLLDYIPKRITDAELVALDTALDSVF